MMNLGLGQKVEISHEKENEFGSENNKGQEVKKEGKGYTASIYIIAVNGLFPSYLQCSISKSIGPIILKLIGDVYVAFYEDAL